MSELVSIELLERYIKGNCTDAEILLVKQWYRSFEHEDDHVSELSPAEEKELEEHIYYSILNNINHGRSEGFGLKKSSYRVMHRWYAVAAAAVVVITLSTIAFFYNQKQKSTIAVDGTDQPVFAITNNSGHLYKLTLPDKSCVWLSPAARISYPKIFAVASRMVSISGECFFEVTKNPKRPFIINSRSIVTKVWGTSFLVRDNDKSNTADVSVLTGKVSVSIKSANTNHLTPKLEKDEVMIYPHQKVICLNDKHILQPENVVAEPALKPWTRVNLLFDNKALSQIIPVLNARFNVHIKVSSEKLNHYILNGDFEGFNLPDVLDALKKSLGIDYQIKNDIIELT